MLTQTSKKINLSNQKCLNYFRLRFGVFVTKKPLPTTCAETLESLDFASSSSLASSPDLQPSSVRPWVWLWHRWCMDGCWRGCPGAVGESFAKILQRGKVFYETNKTTKETETPPFISDLQDSQGADLQQLLQPLWLLLLWKFFNHLCVHQHFCRGCWWLRCCWWWLGETFQDLLGMLRSVTSLSWKLCCFG